MAKDSSNDHASSVSVESQLRALEEQRKTAAENLTRAVAKLEDSKATLAEAEAERNAAMWVAKESGVPMADLIRIAGFKSRDAVYKAIERSKTQP